MHSGPPVGEFLASGLQNTPHQGSTALPIPGLRVELRWWRPPSLEMTDRRRKFWGDFSGFSGLSYVGQWVVDGRVLQGNAESFQVVHFDTFGNDNDIASSRHSAEQGFQVDLLVEILNMGIEVQVAEAGQAIGRASYAPGISDSICCFVGPSKLVVNVERERDLARYADIEVMQSATYTLDLEAQSVDASHLYSPTFHSPSRRLP